MSKQRKQAAQEEITQEEVKEAAQEEVAGAAEPQNPDWDPNGDLVDLSNEGEQQFVTDLLIQAVTLEEERQAHMAKTAANRETLRTVRKTGLLSEKQAAAIDLWYPPRTRKAADNGADAENGAESAENASGTE